MIKKNILVLVLLNIFAFATPGDVNSLTISYENGSLNIEACPLKFEDEVRPAQKDWIGLYKKNDSNSWGNVLTWAWAKELKAVDDIGGCKSLTKHLNQLANGEYEVRYFKNNSFTTFKKSKPFKVNKTTLALKEVNVYYDKNMGKVKFETVIDGFAVPLNNGSKDWVGLYKKGDSNAWGNVITWAWVKDFQGDDDFGVTKFITKNKWLNSGEYEVRYFKDNSFTTYKSHTLSIDYNEIGYLEYFPSSKAIHITASATNFDVNPKDWIAIYKVGDNNSWENVVEWIWAKDTHYDPEQDIGNPYRVFPLKKNYDPTQKYEARYFLNNSFTTFKKSKPFRVSNNTNKINLDFINAISREPNKVTIYVVGVRGQAKPNPKDWIGIYKKGDSNDWKNVVTWVWVKDFISGPGDLPEEKYPEESRTTLKLNVNNEEYEARYFLNNSFTTYMKSKPFQVK